MRAMGGAAHNAVTGRAEVESDDELTAITSRNLVGVHFFRGDPKQSEAMHNKALELEEALMRKDGMASKLHDLG